MIDDLDRIDHALLAALQNNGRASNKELAAEVGLAPSSTHARVKRLQTLGALRGVHADVDPAALGVGLQALVFVWLQRQAPDDLREAWQALAELPQVVHAFYVSGDDDLVLHVAARDTDDLRQAVLEPISAHPLVRKLRTELVFTHQRQPIPRVPVR